MSGIFGWLNGLDPRHAWIVLGLLLSAAEWLAPGAFLVWAGAAAVLTGLAAFALPLAASEQVLLFVMLAAIAVLAGRKRRRRLDGAEPAPEATVVGWLDGRTVVVTEAIECGVGRVRHGESEWAAEGPDAAIGTRMRVAGHDGATLRVEHLH